MAHQPHHYLSYQDRVSEVAFAVLMVIIINGYVALSNLNTGFWYIVGVNLGACFGWGLIDGLVYAITSSLERNSARRQLAALQGIRDPTALKAQARQAVSGSVFDSLSPEGKDAVADAFVAHMPTASAAGSVRLFTREDVTGWLSIISIYLIVGFVLALPFLVLPDKILAWVTSNVIGVIWLFWFGTQLGACIGQHRLKLGAFMATIGLLFLAVSYYVWA